MFTFESEEQFEHFCLDLFPRWKRYSNLQKYGRRGQDQKGLDLVGNNEAGARIGVQCKHYQKVNSDLREQIVEDISNARTVTPPIVHMDICVSADEDRDLVDLAEDEARSNRQVGSFSIQLIFKKELYDAGQQHHQLIEKYAPAAYRAISAATKEGALEDYGREFVAMLQADGVPIQSSASGMRPGPLAKQVVSVVIEKIEQDNNRSAELNALISQAQKSLSEGRPDQTLASTEAALASLAPADIKSRIEILKLRASAFGALEQLDRSAECHERYLEIAPDAPDAPAKRAMVQRLRGNIDEMRRLAEQALSIEGSFDLACALLVSYARSREERDTIVEANRDKIHSHFFACQMVSQAYLLTGQGDIAKSFADKALTFKPADVRARAHAAICNLAAAAPDALPSAVEMLPQKLVAAAKDADRAFSEIWPVVKDATDPILLVGVAQNYSFALEVLGKEAEALAVLEQVPAGVEPSRMAMTKARLLINRMDGDAALQQLALVTDSDYAVEAKKLSLMANQFSSSPTDDVALMDDLFLQVEDNPRLQVSLLHMKGLRLLERDRDGALEVAIKLSGVGATCSSLIYAAHIFAVAGEQQKSREIATAALAQIDAGASVDTDASVIAASYAAEAENLRLAAVCIAWASASANDNQALRMLLQIYGRSGQWAKVRETIGSLPDALRSQPFYKDMEARRHEAGGDIDEALTTLKGSDDPRNPDYQLSVSRLQLLLRHDRRSDARTLSRKLALNVVSAIKDHDVRAARKELRHAAASIPLLSRVLNTLGNSELAGDLLLCALATFTGYAAIEMAYTTGTAQLDPKDVAAAAPGATLAIDTAAGQHKVAISPDGIDLSVFVAAIPNAHAITPQGAKDLGLLGRVVGDDIAINIDGVVTPGRIVGIAENHFLLHQYIFDTFEARYPGRFAFKKLSIERDDNGTPDFTAVFKMIDSIAEENRKTLKLYADHNVPLSFIANLRKMRPYELWEGIVTTPGNRFLTSTGLIEDIQAQVRDCSKGMAIVVEPLTMITWWRTGRLKTLLAIAGRILLTPAVKEVVNELIERIEGRRGSLGTLTKSGNVYVKEDTRDDEIDAQLRELRDLLAWIEQRAEMIAVQPEESPDELSSLVYQFDQPAAQAILLAKAQNAVLWVDDLRMAQLGFQTHKVRCVNWQALVHASLDLKVISADDAIECSAIAAGANYYFVHLWSDLLLAAVAPEVLQVGWKIRALLSSLRHPGDIRLNLAMLVEFLRRIETHPLRHSYLFLAVSALTRDGCVHVDDTVATLFRTVSWTREPLKDWIRGHYLLRDPKAEPAPVAKARKPRKRKK